MEYILDNLLNTSCEKKYEIFYTNIIICLDLHK